MDKPSVFAAAAPHADAAADDRRRLSQRSVVANVSMVTLTAPFVFVLVGTVLAVYNICEMEKESCDAASRRAD